MWSVLKKWLTVCTHLYRMEGSHRKERIFSNRKKWLCLILGLRRLKHTQLLPFFFFFWLRLDNLLKPIHSALVDWIRFMHKAPTHVGRLLMTGPCADTLTATSNYFIYTGEGQNGCDLWEGERQRDWGRHAVGRGLWTGRREKYLGLILKFSEKLCFFFCVTLTTLSIVSEDVSGVRKRTF